jgi:hypothetical protein
MTFLSQERDQRKSSSNAPEILSLAHYWRSQHNSLATVSLNEFGQRSQGLAENSARAIIAG